MINLVKTLDNETQRHIRVSNHPTNRASEGGWVNECLRFLVLARLQPEDRLPVDINLQRIFDEGNHQERLVRQDLEKAGIEVLQTQRDLSWKKFELSGHIDGLVQDGDKLIPLEIKSCSPHIFTTIQKITDAKELLNSSKIWLRRYPAQIMLYMLLMDKEEGILLFKDKATGKKHQINVELDYDYTESILKGLERVNKYVAKKQLPKAERCESCDKCGFARTVCYVGKDFGEGYSLMNDSEAEDKLKRWKELYLAAKEFKEIEKQLKAKYRGKSLILGDFIIESTKYEASTYNIPDDIKLQYCEKAERVRMKIKEL